MSPKRNAASPRATAGRHSSSPPRPVSLRGGEGSSGVSSGLSRRSLLPAAAIAALVLASYLPALRAGFIWDDDLWVTGSDRLGSLRGLLQIWTSVGRAMQYYPLFHSAIWIEHRFWGTNPAGYHLVNVLLQAANAILLWRLLLRLCVPGAWLATALFAVHPVQAASVAWITEQKNLLSLFFSLLSARFYLRAFPPEEADRTGETDRPKETDPPAPPRRGRLYLASILLFFAALLSKMVACTLPAALLLLIWWKRGRVGTRDVRRLAPFFLPPWRSGWPLPPLSGIRRPPRWSRLSRCP